MRSPEDLASKTGQVSCQSRPVDPAIVLSQDIPDACRKTLWTGQRPRFAGSLERIHASHLPGRSGPSVGSRRDLGPRVKSKGG